MNEGGECPGDLDRKWMPKEGRGGAKRGVGKGCRRKWKGLKRELGKGCPGKREKDFVKGSKEGEFKVYMYRGK